MTSLVRSLRTVAVTRVRTPQLSLVDAQQRSGHSIIPCASFCSGVISPSGHGRSIFYSRFHTHSHAALRTCVVIPLPSSRAFELSRPLSSSSLFHNHSTLNALSRDLSSHANPNPQKPLTSSLSPPHSNSEGSGRSSSNQSQDQSGTSGKGSDPQGPSAFAKIRNALIAALLGGLLFAVIYDPDATADAGRIVLRVGRTLVTMAQVAADYKYTWWQNPDEHPITGPESSKAHARCAKKILKLCQTNKGLYIKVGQYLSSLNHALPKEYTSALKVLQDNAPYLDFSVIEEVFREDLGHPPEYFFKEIGRVPIASASLAQVHQAVTHDGVRMAVKVQYPNLRTDFPGDMWTHDFVLWAAGKIFKGFQLQWMHPELYNNLKKELDFEIEGSNADACAHNFRRNPRLHVPLVYWRLTSKRILAMEFIDGVKITNTPALQRLNVPVKDAMHHVTESMSEQIFVHGFVHCDPHPGNIFIHRMRARPSEAELKAMAFYQQPREQVRVKRTRKVRGLRQHVAKLSFFASDNISAPKPSQPIPAFTTNSSITPAVVPVDRLGNPNPNNDPEEQLPRWVPDDFDDSFVPEPRARHSRYVKASWVPRWISGPLSRFFPSLDHDWQVVLLDHGLYRHLSEYTRLHYCKLWQSLILRDDEAVKREAGALGVSTDFWQFFAILVLMRPYAGRVGFDSRVTPKDEHQLRRELSGRMKDILRMMKETPRELLLILRNQSYIRALNAELGRPVNRFKIMARTAVKGLNTVDSDPYHIEQSLLDAAGDPLVRPIDPSVLHPKKRSHKRSHRLQRLMLRLKGVFSTLSFEFHLAAYDTVYWLSEVWVRLFYPKLAAERERMELEQRKAMLNG